MNDAMARLRAADPAAVTDLDGIDAETWALMRDEIAATPIDPAPAQSGARRRAWRPQGMGRRGVVAAGVAALLAGGGVAYAVSATSNGFDPGVGCLPSWPSDEVGPFYHDSVGGPWLTGDAIADCATYAARAGQPPIDDPVAFKLHGLTYVTPASEVPEGATRVTAETARDPAVVELQFSLDDYVDGGSAFCRSLDEARAWAQSELDRLGLVDWHVVTRGVATDRMPCARFFPQSPGIVEIAPSTDPLEGTFTAGRWQLADNLRASITDACLSLEEARAIADLEVTRSTDPFPTTSVLDESVPCARVDATTGGALQVTVYGPTTAIG